MSAGLVLICAVLSSGCSSLRLPQIDPSGQNIFLPAPNYTTITPPGRELYDALESASPKAAWVEPATPPPVTLGRQIPDSEMQLCGFPHAPPGAGPIKGICQKPLEGHVTLSPERIVAPVGSEVVLVSGLCDANGNYVTAEPIEWTMSLESVGNFVQVGERGHSTLARLVSNNPRKISNDFALGRASTEARFITRGTPTPTDDLPLKKGESWVSLTSAKEGVSHVTVLAPHAQNWDMRKRIASVFWVDAQWLLPTPSVARASETHVLETVLSRSRDFTPIANWIVRYEVIDGPPAVFPAAGNDSVVEVITDADGRAAVEIQPTTNESGTTVVRVDIIQPATPDGSRPRLTLNQTAPNTTTVTWSVPDLKIQVLGPETAGAQSDASYRIEVQNPGDVPLSNVIVTGSLTGGARLIQSSLEHATVGDNLEWRIGDLPAHTAVPIDCNVRLGDESLQFCARVDCDEKLTANECRETAVEAAALVVTMRGPEREEAPVGEFVEFIAEVSNRSSRDIHGVTVTDTFELGLEHESGQQSPIIRDLGTLRAGQTQPISINFRVRQLGELCHTVEAVANSGERASAKGCIRGVAPEEFIAGPLRVRKTGPLQARVGETIQYAIEIENTGDKALTDLIITDEYDVALNVTRLTEDHKLDRAARTIEWRVDTIAPGQALTFQAEYECLRPAVNAGNVVRVTTGDGHSASGEARTQIAPAAVSMRPTGFARSGSPALRTQDGWETSVKAVDGEKSGSSSFVVVVKNLNQSESRDVYLEITSPESMKVADAKTKLAPVRRKGGGGRTVIVGPISVVRGEETLLPIEVQLTGRTEGRNLSVTVRANGESD
jgi:uncharacterized repeat protein (TIGR01451 family)